ncbi:MAG TPA: hypothetical protein VNW46_17195 [Gemmatimonadaceae bacterium]|nr:hypothetical protein [Gemmatimonadaceae bacterium]
MKTLLQGTATLAAMIAACAIVGLAWLVLPGTPGRSRFMRFDGYIELPKGGALNVMDYLTLAGSTLFVTSESSGSLFKIDLDPAQPARSAVSEMRGSGAAHGVALLAEQNVAFVTRSGANTVDVFAPQSLDALGHIPVADDADAILYDAATKLVYVANGDAKLATLIDPATRAAVGTIALPGKPEFPAIDAQTGLLYQNLEDLSAVVAVDLGTRSVVGQWSLAPCRQPTGMAIDAGRRRLFAVCGGNATMVVFDLDAHTVVASVGIGGKPDAVAFDLGLHRIYTAGLAGRLTVIQQVDADTYRVLDNIRTHFGAHTLTVDPVTHRVFVAYASLLARPRIAVFSPALVVGAADPAPGAVRP